MCLGYSKLLMDIVSYISRVLIQWPSTPKFDMATWAFLKIDMQHGA